MGTRWRGGLRTSLGRELGMKSGEDCEQGVGGESVGTGWREGLGTRWRGGLRLGQGEGGLGNSLNTS